MTSANRHLHGLLADLVGARKRLCMTYVPFCSEGAPAFYRRFQRRYAPFGFTHFHYMPVDKPFTPEDLERALASDAIYLAGGNTFYFLHHLRQRKLLGRFRSFAERGGVIAGLSAGAIILTPNIGLAGYPPSDADRNDVKLKDLRALGLVPFEFFPHYVPRSGLRESLSAYSGRSTHSIIACADGGGVVVEGTRMTFIGRTELFLAGAHARINV